MTTTVNEPAERLIEALNDEVMALEGGIADWDKAVEIAAAALAAERAIGAEAHDATYVDDGADGYLACRCGWGHVLGEDALVDHIHDARLTRERNGQ